MDLLANISTGFGIALSPANLLFCLLGTVLGTVIGVLPGIGPMAGCALLLPLTFGMNPTTAIIMMSGIYYGAMYGGSTTSILIKVPGEVSSVVTMIDGYAMAQNGRAGAALATSAIGSFIAGTVSTVGLMCLAQPMANLALKFGPPEYFALMALGMTMVSSLAGSSVLKAVISALFGLVLATVGIDLQSGVPRFAFGVPSLLNGIEFLIVAIGLFAVAEVLVNAGKPEGTEERLQAFVGKLWTPAEKLWMTADEWRRSVGPWLRGTFSGFFVGLLPGAASTLASFLSYDMERKLSRSSQRFGQGMIEGVAGPEAANNSAVGGGMIPLLTLGLPVSGTTAVMLGAFVMYGLQPGPLLFQTNPDFVWAVIASMYIGNVMLLIQNLPLVGLFAKILNLPYGILFPLILAFCVFGVYAMSGSLFDLWLMVGFGVIGFVMQKHDFPGVPMILALVLGREMEQAFRQSLTLSNGSLLIFLTRPVSLILLCLAAASIAATAMGVKKSLVLDGKE
jgi:putative tricarboxylic transport membrane protein